MIRKHLFHSFAGFYFAVLVFGSLLGGISAVSAETAPVNLAIERVNAELMRLRWNGTGAFTLQQKEKLESERWIDALTSIFNTTEVAPSGETGFFRVRRSSE